MIKEIMFQFNQGFIQQNKQELTNQQKQYSLSLYKRLFIIQNSQLIQLDFSLNSITDNYIIIYFLYCSRQKQQSQQQIESKQQKKKMATTKREFIQMYDQAVTLLKQYKHQNDTLNKSIGLQHSSTLSIKLRSQQSFIQQLIKRIDQILRLLQESYLDPQTARKIGTIKQQYKIQKDRRIYIIKQIQQSQKVSDHNVMPKQTAQRQIGMGNYYQLVNNNTKYQQGNKNSKNNNNSSQYYRRLDLNNSNNNNQKQTEHYQHTRTTLTQQQLTQYDYEIQCKLLQQRNKSLQQTQKRMKNVYNITKQTKQMIDFQGQHLDIISDEIFKAREHVKDALGEIKQANQLNKKRRMKVITGVSMILLLLAVVVVVVFVV